MKISQSRRGFFLAVVAGACLFPSISHAATLIVGSGDDTSFLLLESPNLGVRTYEIHYTFSVGTPQDAYFLLSQVIGADTSFTANVFGNGNYYLDSIVANTVTEGYDGTNYWAHWVSGGSAGFPSAAPVADGTWTQGAGMSAPYRQIEPGSWDSFYFSDGNVQPSIAPIPETSTALLGVIGSFVIFRRRRNG